MHDPWVISGISVTLKRSARRRTVGLQVRPGAVTLYAPARIPAERLQLFLADRRGWVEGHLQRYAAQLPVPGPLTGDSTVRFLGEELTLRLGGTRQARREDNLLWLPCQDPEQHLEAWTRRAAAAPYRALVEEYAGLLGARPRLRRVVVSRARTRWGSCTQRGDIRLHWKLSRAPLDVLRYVALHEAAHLLELNHSPRYWAHVARVMPEYPTWRRWLREQGQTL